MGHFPRIRAHSSFGCLEEPQPGTIISQANTKWSSGKKAELTWPGVTRALNQEQRARNRHVNHKLLLLPINANQDCIHKGKLLYQQALKRIVTRCQLKGDWHTSVSLLICHKTSPFSTLLLQENSPQPALPSGQNQQGHQCPLGCQSQSTSILHSGSALSCSSPPRAQFLPFYTWTVFFHPIFISSTTSFLNPLFAPRCPLLPFLSGWMRQLSPLLAHKSTHKSTFLGSGRTEAPQDMQELRSDCHSHSYQSRGDAVPQLTCDSVICREQHSTRDTKTDTGCHTVVLHFSPNKLLHHIAISL